MPHAVVIVAGVVIGVGAIYVVGQHVYPKVQPHVEEFWRVLKENRRQRSERPYASMSDEDYDQHDVLFSHDQHEAKEMEDKPLQMPPPSSAAFSTSTYRPFERDGLRQRSQAASSTTAHEKILDADVEMVQLDKSKSSYPLMTPKPRLPSPPPIEDINPFEEPAVPVAVAIPLPQSPTASFVADPIARSSPVLQRSHIITTTTNNPFELSLNDALDENPTPIATSAPRLPAAASPRTSPRASRPHMHHRSSSSVSSNMLSPPMIPNEAMGTIRGPPPAFVRPSSPSNASDPMSGSFISAAPSRDWTEGGTNDIFSGSERESGYHDSDVDGVQSASDSDWEELDSARAASPAAQRQSARH